LSCLYLYGLCQNRKVVVEVQEARTTIKCQLLSSEELININKYKQAPQ
jgi:hypothetical protein